jgi:cytochrome c-type biogenesis protein CcmE
MLSRKVKLRITILTLFLIVAAVLVVFILRSLKENVVYFFSPTEVNDKENISFNKTIRIGGLVKKNSINKKNNSINFVITDLNNEIVVSYSGSVPNLFSEEKGVVAEGKLKDKKYFIAEKILAKHDENYMPPEVSEALEKTKK